MKVAKVLGIAVALTGAALIGRAIAKKLGDGAVAQQFTDLKDKLVEKAKSTLDDLTNPLK